jgi:glycosyltransferase involved in cell wall biosynthesis
MSSELNLDLNSEEQIRPLVTIGVPTYNRPEGLEKTISFLLKQEYDNIEIKISDNCSTNIRIKEILEKYALQDKRVTYTIQKTNIQIEPNFNYVYTGATGKYFMWLADDDSFENNYIGSCVDFLEKNTDYLLCSGGCKYLKGGNVSYLEIDKSLESNSPLKRMFRYLYYVNKNGLFYGVYRNNIKFVKPIEKHIGADWCHLARIALLGKIKVLDHIVNVRSDEGEIQVEKK